ncbi:MAG: ribosomal protein L13e [Candidatus Bathyarchaeia archaeon]|nr:ribosomal protein L13e [Candidatus Bathyarchaeota archaeon]
MHIVRPLVFKKNGKQRTGKGFSLGELKEAGLNKKQALMLRIPVDSRRRTVHTENIENLKKILEKEGKSEKTKSKKEEAKEKTKRGKKEKRET